MAKKYRKETCFIPIADSSSDVFDEIMDWIGYEKTKGDMTRSMGQIYKMLQTNAIKNEEIREYSIPTIKNLDIFDFDAGLSTEEEYLEVQRYILSQMVYDYVIMDISYDCYNKKAEAALNSADLVIMVINNNDFVQRKAIEILQSHPVIKEKSQMIVINQYESKINTQKGLFTSKKSKYKEFKNASFLHYSYLIPKYSNESNFIYMMNNVSDGTDVKLLEITNDLDSVSIQILKHSGDEIAMGRR